jgi:NADP-dependent 3-hydroxy acid dehydrogenase YdfG
MSEVRRQFETNVFGLLRLTQLVLPGMRRQRWGKIVNLSSMGGRMTLPGGGIYHATKYAVEALSDALRFEVRGFGVDVIVIEWRRFDALAGRCRNCEPADNSGLSTGCAFSISDDWLHLFHLQAAEIRSLRARRARA